MNLHAMEIIIFFFDDTVNTAIELGLLILKFVNNTLAH